jgi:hypothetical protein
MTNDRLFVCTGLVALAAPSGVHVAKPDGEPQT